MQDLGGRIVWGDGHFQGAEQSVKVLFPKSEMFLELNFVEVSGVFSWQGSVVGHAWYVCEGSNSIKVSFFFVVVESAGKSWINRITSAASLMVLRSFWISRLE